ncbi:MAG: SGNH/GDSL hydrolase family protein [Deltaproteobacteria bacterium]|nr:SGNH/GDSL hydrolase family protein [Deltaproteobacteria bacterium]
MNRTDPGEPPPPPVPVRLMQVVGYGLLALGLVYNEFLLTVVDPSPPITPSTLGAIHNAQLIFVLAGLVSLGSSVLARRSKWLRAFVGRPPVENLVVFVALMVVPLSLLEIAARPFNPPLAIDQGDLLPPKPAGTYRVVVIGGSTVYGTPSPEFGFVAQLDAALRGVADSTSIEVVNYGRPAATSAYVRDVVERTVTPATTDLLVVLTAHNEFLTISDDPRPRWLIASTTMMRRSALFRMCVRVRDRIKPPSPRTIEVPGRLESLNSSDRRFQRALRGFDENLRAVAVVARSRRVPLMLITGPSNMGHWPPVHRGIAWASPNPNYDEDIEELTALVDSQPAEVAARIEKLVGDYGSDGMYSFLLARAAQARGDLLTARERYREARDLDPRPWRALSTTNEIIRLVAREYAVTLVDAERIFEEHAQDSIVGFELISDNVHPTPLGSAILASAIVAGMRRSGHMVMSTEERGSPEEALALFLDRFDQPGRVEELLAESALRNGIYCMKPPFFYFADARRYFLEAIRLSPSRWEAWANLGTLSLLEGDRDGALRELAQAVAAKGEPLDSLDVRQVGYLAYATGRAGLSLPYGR